MTQIKFITKSEKIYLANNEHLIVFDILLEGEKVERNIKINLDGEGASVEVYGIFFGNQNQRFISSHTVNHNASRTSSYLLTKGVLDDKAVCAYRSLIDIQPGATGCKGEQKEDTMILSREAHIDAVPALQIGNDDVKASHSVSATYLDEVKKFYLEARGLSESEAESMAVFSHLADILDKIEDKSLKEKIVKKINVKVGERPGRQ